MEIKGHKIGDISKRLSISPRTMRYYEELGLISTERSIGGFRVFSDSQVEKLRTIIALKEIGMPLEEIKTLLQLRQHGATGSETAPRLLDYLAAKIADIKKTMARHAELLKELESVVKIVENCKCCGNKTEELSCEKCVDERTHHKVPALMKSLL